MKKKEELSGVEVADGEYFLAKAEARLKGLPLTVTVPIIEKRLGLRRGALSNYRANAGRGEKTIKERAICYTK